MKIDGTGAENLIEKYYNFIFYLISLCLFGLFYSELSDSENPKNWILLLPYTVSLVALSALSKNLNGSKKKKIFIIIFTIIIPWLFLLLVWLGK